MGESADEKKIIIDEDWKSRAQAEKETAEKRAAEAVVQEEPAAGPAGRQSAPPPPANFQTLASMLATQAMMSLGAFANPATGKPEIQLNEAKHFIDLLGVVEEKTQGNLTPDESKMIAGMLHELRMAFVAAEHQATTAADEKS